MRTFKDKEVALDFVLNQVLWGNAAGTCKDAPTTKKFAQTGMPLVMFGSMTASAWAGNEGENFYYDAKTGNSINALGLPNRGIDDYLTMLPELHQATLPTGSMLGVSISALKNFSALEYHDMAKKLRDADAADLIEGNFSCPNVEIGGKRKPVVCFDLIALAEGVRALKEGADNIPVSVKIAPITEARLLSDIANICIELKVDYLVGANTMGNCYVENLEGKAAISMKRGGGAGKMLRPIIRGMTQMLEPQLRGTCTKFLAVGGISNGKDAYDSLCDGAYGFGFNTVLSANPSIQTQTIEHIIFGCDIEDVGEEKRHQLGLLDFLVEKGLPN